MPSCSDARSRWRCGDCSGRWLQAERVQERWQALRLSRRQKAAALAAASLCIWMSAGWSTRLQVLLLGALTVRCNLKPAEVRASAQVVECFSLQLLLRRNVIHACGHLICGQQQPW